MDTILAISRVYRPWQRSSPWPRLARTRLKSRGCPEYVRHLHLAGTRHKVPLLARPAPVTSAPLLIIKLSSLAAKPLCAGLLPCLQFQANPTSPTRRNRLALPVNAQLRARFWSQVRLQATPLPARKLRQWPRRPPWRIRLDCLKMPWLQCASRRR